VGLSQYFYAGSRVGVFLLAFLIWQLWRENSSAEPNTEIDPDSEQFVEERPKPERMPLIIYTLKMGLVAACIAAPLFLFALRDPVPFFDRSKMVWGWKPDSILLATGDAGNIWPYAWRQLWRSLGAFTAVPDVTGFSGPGVPLLIGLAAPLFVVGLLWAVYRRHFLPVLWIALTALLGGFLLSDPPGSSHYVVAIPAICWLAAMPLEWLAASGRERLAVGLLVAVLPQRGGWSISMPLKTVF
jgi:hypothetical protein